MSTKISAVVNFCSNDYRFFDFCIKQISLFSNKIYVSVSDHFFNGEKENYALLENLYQKYPECQFIEFSYVEKPLYGPREFSALSSKELNHYWHNVGRLCPYYFIDEDCDWIFYFDIDEIPDGKEMLRWLDSGYFKEFDALRFASYVYFREAHYRGSQWQSAPLLIRRASLVPENLFDVNERRGVLEALEGKIEKFALGLDGLPMIHHYNWVRSKVEILKKVKSWAHRDDVQDWEAIIEKTFSHSFDGTDFFNEQTYERVSPFFDPMTELIPDLDQSNLEIHLDKIGCFQNVHRVNPADIFRMDLLWRVR